MRQENDNTGFQLRPVSPLTWSSFLHGFCSQFSAAVCAKSWQRVSVQKSWQGSEEHGQGGGSRQETLHRWLKLMSERCGISTGEERAPHREVGEHGDMRRDCVRLWILDQGQEKPLIPSVSLEWKTGPRDRIRCPWLNSNSNNWIA